MTAEKKQSLEEIEAQVKELTSTKHQRELRLLTDVLDMYIDGFNSINSFTYTQDNKTETAWLLLVTRSFHSMRCAMQLTLMGYYGQAISLLRTVTENLFVCHDCIENPKTIEAILHNKYEIPSRNNGLTFSKMAKRTGNLRIYRKDYNHQSKVTHPSALSLGIIRDPETNAINAAPSYDKILFLDCFEIMVRNALMISEFMERFLLKFSEDKGNSWESNARQTHNVALAWLQELRVKYGKKKMSALSDRTGEAKGGSNNGN